MIKKVWQLLLIIGYTLLIFNACSSDEISYTASSDDVPSSADSNPYRIEKEDAVAETNAFIEQMLAFSGKTNLRSASFVELTSEVKTMNEIMLVSDPTGTKQVMQVIPIYMINYKNKGNESSGYALTVGDKRVPNRILAFEEEGQCELFTGSNAGFWKERITEYINEVLNTKNSTERADAELRVEKPNIETFMIPMNTKWHQLGTPYIDCTPFYYDSAQIKYSHSSAGCNAVALGEIMAYYKWPQFGVYKKEVSPGEWEVTATSYTFWDEIQVENPNTLTNPDAKAHVSNLLAEAGYKIGTKYKGTSATAVPSGAVGVLKRMGYTDVKFERYFSYDVKLSLSKGSPVFMAAYTKSMAGHSFVVNGWRTFGNAFYVHIKNGNGGSGDGFFYSYLFELSNSYRYWNYCFMITDIEPDYSDPGSTDINRWDTNR